MEKTKTLELLNVLFDAARGDYTEDWSDEAYILADLIKLVEQPTEIAIRELLTEDMIDTLDSVYKIPKGIASKYVRREPEFMDNVMDRVYETTLFELENWLGSTDIIIHQGKKDPVLEVK